MAEKMKAIQEEAENKINQMQIELAKKDILMSYGDEIIPEMISGSTIEEIQQSAENAHKKYIEILEKTKVSKIEQKKKTALGSDVEPKTSSKIEGIDSESIRDIKDPAEWERVKKELMSKLGIEGRPTRRYL